MAEDSPDKIARKARRAARKAQAEAPPLRPDPAEILGDIDAWNLRFEQEWLRFDAHLEMHPRAYQRPVAGGDILADAPGPLMAVLGLGGPRAAGFSPGPATRRWNILAPADHIGAVGMEGQEHARPSAGLAHIPHRSAEALLAEALLCHRERHRRSRPLIFVRAETDASASIAALHSGMAFANFKTAIDSLCSAAQSLNRPARVLAVRLDYGLEDLSSDSTALVTGTWELMAEIEAGLRAKGLPPPVFLTRAETGTARIADHPAIHAGWALAQRPGPHRHITTTPAYALSQDRFGRLDDRGRADQAVIEAHALDLTEAGAPWACPQPLLAEAAGGQIRVTFSALSDLVLDEADPFAAGPAAGFRLVADGQDLPIHAIRIAPDDPRTLILDCSPGKGALMLYHACNLLPLQDGKPINRSRIRDQWQAAGPEGVLHRWALPAALPVHPAPAPLSSDSPKDTA